MQEKSKS